MSMVLSTRLPALCRLGDTCVVLVLQGTRSQYPPSILEVGGGGRYSPPPLLMLRSPKPSPLECSSNRRHCTLLFEISIQQLQILGFNEARFLLSMSYAPYALLLECCLCFYVHFKLHLGLQNVWFTTCVNGSCCESMYGCWVL